jgi:phosphopantothenoylcysteine synthetase/decarboxylase
VADLKEQGQSLDEHWSVRPYGTFDDLQAALAEEVRRPGLDAVIHSAAVSDYRSGGVFAPAGSTRFRQTDATWQSTPGEAPRLADVAAGKVKSYAPELWLRLVRTPKLVDLIRSAWGFHGVLVKFKLEVEVSDEHLLEIAEKSRRQSDADLMVANTLEGANIWAFLGPFPGDPKGSGHYQRISRGELPVRLLQAVEHLHRERSHG